MGFWARKGGSAKKTQDGMGGDGCGMSRKYHKSILGDEMEKGGWYWK